MNKGSRTRLEPLAESSSFGVIGTRMVPRVQECITLHILRDVRIAESLASISYLIICRFATPCVARLAQHITCRDRAILRCQHEYMEMNCLIDHILPNRLCAIGGAVCWVLKTKMDDQVNK